MLERLTVALQKVRELTEFSLSKNNLGIDDIVETTDSDESLMSDEREKA